MMGWDGLTMMYYYWLLVQFIASIDLTRLEMQGRDFTLFSQILFRIQPQYHVSLDALLT